MIITITLNPALDVSGFVDSLIPNEKSYVRDEIYTPGGNGINAAIIAHRLNAKVEASGFLGGCNGAEIMSLLEGLKLKYNFVPIAGRTRMNLTVNNCDNHKQTRLSFPGPKIKPAELKEMENYLLGLQEKEMIIFGGSLPPGIKPAFVARMVKELKARGHTCMVDMPGKILSEVVKSRPYFIKPNLIEFQDMVGKKASTIKSILPLVRSLKLPLVCVSSVEDGAILVSPEEAWFGKIPRVKIQSTVGAGDSMVGAMAAVLAKNPHASVAELLRRGLAAACATLTEKGMVLASKKAMQNYYPQIIMREIK